jgi:hypothetical protein
MLLRRTCLLDESDDLLQHRDSTVGFIPFTSLREPSGVIGAVADRPKQVLKRRRALHPRTDVPAIAKKYDRGRRSPSVRGPMSTQQRFPPGPIDDAERNVGQESQSSDIWHGVSRVRAPVFGHDKQLKALPDSLDSFHEVGRNGGTSRCPKPQLSLHLDAVEKLLPCLACLKETSGLRPGDRLKGRGKEDRDCD